MTKIIGLIAEYNPFHLGHVYQINEIKKKYPDSIIITVISPTFTERGDISIINKWNKTKICLDNKIDIVIELPTVFATQSADIFAKGAISLLNKLKIDTLVFGTEEDNLDKIKKIASLQENDKYQELVKQNVNTGMNYPTAMSKAINNFLGYKIDKPNDLLAISYIKEINKQNNKINAVNIKRTTNYHGEEIVNDITSASNIRMLLKDNKDISRYLPPYKKEYIYNINIENLYYYLKYQIINNINNLKIFQTVDEGIENRIKKYIYISNNWSELVNNIKTKRYTYNKINRMLLHILLSFEKELAKNIEINYIRILGFSTAGKDYLNKIKKDIKLPVITSYKKNISYVLDFEVKVTSIYSLITKDDILELEYKAKPIIKDMF